MPSNATAVWLPRVLFESALIVVSILVALGLDEWRESREDEQLVRHALTSFLSEMHKNKLLVEDDAPFNRGLRNVLDMHYQKDDISSVDEFIVMVESYSPIDLHSTAWETALATGSLAKMDYTLVSALSLTYSQQSRYDAITQSGLNEVLSPQNLTDDTLKLAIYNSIRYLDNVATAETELAIIYDQAIAVVDMALSHDAPIIQTGL